VPLRTPGICVVVWEASPDRPRGHWPSAAPAMPYCVLMNDYWPATLGAAGLVAVEASFATSLWFKILLTWPRIRHMLARCPHRA
jgi:hypothetical protein